VHERGISFWDFCKKNNFIKDLGNLGYFILGFLQKKYPANS
jgi:hypothetical protein